MQLQQYSYKQEILWAKLINEQLVGKLLILNPSVNLFLANVNLKKTSLTESLNLQYVTHRVRLCRAVLMSVGQCAGTWWGTLQGWVVGSGAGVRLHFLKLASYSCNERKMADWERQASVWPSDSPNVLFLACLGYLSSSESGGTCVNPFPPKIPWNDLTKCSQCWNFSLMFRI